MAFKSVWPNVDMTEKWVCTEEAGTEDGGSQGSSQLCAHDLRLYQAL